MACIRVVSPLAGSIVLLAVESGGQVGSGDLVAVVESMKMEHEVRATEAGVIESLRCGVGDLVAAGDQIALLRPQAQPAPASETPADSAADDIGALRADLLELRTREALLADASRAEAVAKRHALGMRSARENIADLCDAGSFVEYGGLAFAAQERRRERDDLLRNTPADGMVTGIGSVNGHTFGAERSRAVAMAYDATVLAGTQGLRNHQKTDRLLAIANAERLPVVLFAEGGGGRPGDVDMPVTAGLHVTTFASFARLSGRVPLIGIAAGRCFAGNAALLGCCDVTIATCASSIGMGGPAMVEGGGLGTFRPEQIGPSDVQSRSGVIDIVVADEAEGVAVARRYLAYFQGRVAAPAAVETAALRELLPASRLRSYDVRVVIAALFDGDSTLELRAGFGAGMVTALARIDGRAVGVMANNPRHLGGAIDADAADKAARFLQLCDAHALPIVSLIDTPGFMVGPEIEARAQVRHVSRMFVVGAALRVPVAAIVLRKAYGLGAMAMAAGGMHAPIATVAWPSGEFGAMGLEGAVALGYRKELAAVVEGSERDALRARLVAEQYEKGKAIHMAETLEIDAVIDPAESRRWLVATLDAAKLPSRAAAASSIRGERVGQVARSQPAPLSRQRRRARLGRSRRGVGAFRHGAEPPPHALLRAARALGAAPVCESVVEARPTGCAPELPMIQSVFSARPRRRAMARWCTAAGLAAAVSAVTLTACGPRDEAPLAGSAGTQTSAATTPAPMATAPVVPTASTTTTQADAPRTGTAVPATQAPLAALAPAPAMAPPPPAVAQATATQPNVRAASTVTTAPAAAADDRVDARRAPGSVRVAQKPAAPSGRLGSIESIEPLRERPQGTGAGAVIGGVAGAVLGNQFGHGLGRAAMTGFGAAGGAIAGNNVERNVRKQIVGYRVHVRLDNGSRRTFERDQIGSLQVGDRVRVDANGFRRA